MNIKQIFHGIRSSGDEFTPFYELENDFKRIALLWSVAGLVVSPIFCLLVYNTEVSKVYFYIGLSNIICFPVYILLFYFIQPIKDKLVYVLIGHLFVLTYFAYTDLLAHDFELFHFFCFYSLYTVFIYVIQRLYSAILYSFYVFALLLDGFQHAEVMEVSKSGSIGLFLVIALCAILVLASRRRMINSVEGYSEYLKKIVNNSGIGYVLYSTYPIPELLTIFFKYSEYPSTLFIMRLLEARTSMAHKAITKKSPMEPLLETSMTSAC